MTPGHTPLRNRARWNGAALAGCLSALLAACGGSPIGATSSRAPETDAQRQARWAAAPWPPQPIPGSNPAEPRENLPYFWPYPDVPPPRWPQPHPEARPDRGMSRMEYFNKLCTLEAGEFIYRTVRDVPGYYVIRPRLNASVAPLNRMGSTYLTSTIYAIEDPFGMRYDFAAMLNDVLSKLRSPLQGGYDFIELPRMRWRDVPHWNYYLLGREPPKDPLVVEVHLFLNKADVDGPDPRNARVVRRDVMVRNGGEGRFARYVRQEKPELEEDWIRMYRKVNPNDPELTRARKDSYTYHPTVETIVDELRSEYGVLWRGISRPYDREMGIAGGELIVLHLRTNEIVAVHRGFAMVGRAAGEFFWGEPLMCPATGVQIETPFKTLQPHTPMTTPTNTTGSQSK